MISNAKQLLDEHEAIELELQEIEVIMEAEAINYGNLRHVLKKLISLWDAHEKNEEEIFAKYQEKKYGIPYKQILFEHGQLGKYRKAIQKALDSGSEGLLKETLQKSGITMISQLRKHINDEDEILYRLPQEADSSRKD